MSHDKITEIVSRMTLEEKASLCSGRDFWSTKAVERLGIESWMMTDGPHGLRKQAAASDALGLHQSVPATCFPSAAGLGATWNKELVREVGEALGVESSAENVGVILGPGANIKRSPLCGRNFEYFSEDPLLAGELAAAHVRGVQSQGVGASLKHFAANNQERLRMTIDAVVDERTLREIYLTAFETAVKKAKPWTVMCAYNKLNGTYCSQNKRLLTGILRDEWGFDGIVVTDWGACDDRVAGLAAGQDLEMPSSGPDNDRSIVEAVRSGRLDERTLDRAVERNLRLFFRVKEGRGKARSFDPAAHHALARRAAAEASVLLKNEANLLPLPKEGKVAFLGAFAKTPRYQGGGSSHINPTRVDAAWDEAVRSLSGTVELSYAAGYDPADSRPVPALLAEARAAAAAADIAVVFAGLTDDFESEGFDRAHLRMPESHIALIREAAASAKKTVVVLSCGAPIEMPWLAGADAVVLGYLGGQAGGSAAVDILFGDAEPSGRLAETFPLRLEDNPSYLNFPGGADTVEYREGVFVGYRHYDSAAVPVLFPFGYGLSYTNFEYSDAAVDKDRLSDLETVTVSVSVKNAGTRSGKETVQLYVEAAAASVPRPRKELKGFEKIDLAPGESKRVSFVLDSRAFAFWDAASSRWRAESGGYVLRLGSSSADLRAAVRVELSETAPRAKVYDRNTVVADLLAHPAFARAGAPLLAALRAAFGVSGDASVQSLMMDALIRELPLRNLKAFASAALPPNALETMLEVASGKRPASDAEALFG